MPATDCPPQAGHQTIGGKSYWFSWDSDESVLKNARWNWFTARNYCRKRCMDLVSRGADQPRGANTSHAFNFRWPSRTTGSRSRWVGRWRPVKFGRCGPLGACVTRRWTGARRTGSSRTTSGAGSGPRPCSPWGRLTSTTGAR